MCGKGWGGVLVLTRSLAGKACIVADEDLQLVPIGSLPSDQWYSEISLYLRTWWTGYNLTWAAPHPPHNNTICCHSLPPGVHVWMCVCMCVLLRLNSSRQIYVKQKGWNKISSDSLFFSFKLQAVCLRPFTGCLVIPACSVLILLSSYFHLQQLFLSLHLVWGEMIIHSNWWQNSKLYISVLIC